MLVWSSTEGEHRLPAKWTTCIVCRTTVRNGPTCDDYACIIEAEKR